MTRGSSRQVGIPPVQCTARTKRGTDCQNWCSVGRVTCYLHGGAAGQLVRKADERVTFAQLLQSDPRPVAVVLMDSLHNVDVATRDMRARLVETGEPVTLDALDRFISLSRVSAHLAKTVVDAGVLTKLAEQRRVGLAELGQFMSDVLVGVLNAVPLTPEWRAYLVDVAEHRLLTIARTAGAQVMEVPSGVSLDPPVPPSGPVLAARAGA